MSADGSLARPRDRDGEGADAVLGSLRCRPGTKIRGRIDAAPTFAVDGSIGVGIVHGVEPGPTLAVVAGIHGSEYAGIEAAVRLFRDADPQRLRGTLLIVPVANAAAFAGGIAHVNPIDGVNLNRAFPGDGGRTLTYRIARMLLEEVAARSDAVVDLHGADLGEVMVPCVSAMTTGEGAGDATTMELARVYGTEFVRTRPAATARGTFVGEARIRGIPAILCELGTAGVAAEPDVEAHGHGLGAVMRHLGMVEGTVVQRAEPRVAVAEELLVAEQGGVFRPTVQASTQVRAGDVVAEVTDEWGDVLEQHRVAHDGVVRLMFLRRVVQPGNPLVATMRFS